MNSWERPRSHLCCVDGEENHSHSFPLRTPAPSGSKTLKILRIVSSGSVPDKTQVKLNVRVMHVCRDDAHCTDSVSDDTLCVINGLIYDCGFFGKCWNKKMKKIKWMLHNLNPWLKKNIRMKQYQQKQNVLKFFRSNQVGVQRVIYI